MLTLLNGAEVAALDAAVFLVLFWYNVSLTSLAGFVAADSGLLRESRTCAKADDLKRNF